MSSFAAVLKVSIPAAVGVALEPANTGAEVRIVDILSSSKQAEDCLLFTVRRLKAMNLASASKKDWECGL